MTNYIIHDITTKATFKEVLEKLEGMGVRWWYNNQKPTGRTDLYSTDWNEIICLRVEVATAYKNPTISTEIS
jgi:hypothetical protein